jgi:hypothetical protein
MAGWISAAGHRVNVYCAWSMLMPIAATGRREIARMRWSFNNIRNDSFIWRGEKSHDEGKTWRLTDEYHLKRRSAAPSQNVKR